MTIPTKRRLIHSFQFKKIEDTARLVERLATIKIEANPARSLFQLIELQNAAKEIINRRYDERGTAS
jgi:hypothetical protein